MRMSDENLRARYLLHDTSEQQAHINNMSKSRNSYQKKSNNWSNNQTSWANKSWEKWKQVKQHFSPNHVLAIR